MKAYPLDFRWPQFARGIFVRFFLGEKQSWAEPKPPEVRLIPKSQLPAKKPYATVPAQVHKADVKDSANDGTSSLTEESKSHNSSEDTAKSKD